MKCKDTFELYTGEVKDSNGEVLGNGSGC